MCTLNTFKVITSLLDISCAGRFYFTRRIFPGNAAAVQGKPLVLP
jgi:hypothetical protein